MPNIWKNNFQKSYNICPILVQYLSNILLNICPIFVKFLPNFCQYLPYICIIFAQYFLNICQILAKYLSNIFSIFIFYFYAQNLSIICTIFKLWKFKFVQFCCHNPKAKPSNSNSTQKQPKATWLLVWHKNWFAPHIPPHPTHPPKL